ncbi:alpha/beta hydrolase [Paenibacillus turpanensis]|uniref:alpha/beta hydrolase n=1 Tax=Paenibacillus turpanensis TaxID=2689078 RepID=UPI00140731F6|nr:alpha/beta hydrolase [Paenibacillus turpanensis]
MLPYVIAFFAFLTALIFIAAVYFSKIVLYMRTHNDLDIFLAEAEARKFDKDVYERLTKQEVRIDSPMGYPLHAVFIPAPGPASSRKTVILAHGVTSSHSGMIKYMDLFLPRGFNVLAYDHRRHGKSGGTTTTYGLYEKLDLKACVDWVFEKTGPESVIGIFGESMGAATALQHAAIDSRAAFYIADCPYSDFTEQLKYRLRIEYRLPAFPLIPIVSFVAWLRSGFRFGAASPIRTLHKVEVPVLFIHGTEDTYIPKEMSVDLYEKKEGVKGLYLAPNADHAEAYWKNKEEYNQIVGQFLEGIGVIKPQLQKAQAE